jgi:tripartite ATP-independent transporter DctM subunit
MSADDSTETQPAAASPKSALNRVGDGMDIAVEAFSGALLVFTAGVALVQVFFRYGLNSSLPWPEELARWCFVWLIFVGVSLGVRRDTHIRIDLLARSLPAGLLPAHRFFVLSLVAAAATVFVIHGFELAGRATYVSPALGLSFRYLYAAVPTGGAITLLMIAVGPTPGTKNRLFGLGAIFAGGALYALARLAGPILFSGQAPSSLLMIAALVLIALGVPIAYSLVLGAFLAFTPKPPVMLLTITQNMTSALDSFILLAIPFFILAAAAMNAGGITTRLVDLATRLVGHFRGGLGHVNVLTNTMMAGVSGSSMADAAAIGKILIPSMAKHGYPRAFSSALTSASSVIANLIPPSLGLIIYGALAQVSVGSLFVAAIVPGFLLAGVLAIVVAVVARRRGYGAGIERASRSERLNALVVALPALILPVLIVGGVRFGVFTASEAGAMAFLYAVVIGAVFYRQLTLRKLVTAVRDALHDTLAVVIIIAAAAPFAWVLASEQLPQKLAAFLGGVTDSAIVLLLLINASLLVIGLFMEMIAAMVILVPIFVPIIIAAGISPIQFGVVVVINLVIGALTPPLGMLIFTTARVGGVDVSAVFRAVLPFLVGMIAVLFLVTLVPEVSLGLTRIFGP